MGCAASVGREDANEPFDYNEDEDWNASYKLAHDHSEQERRANILDERAKSRGMRRDGSGKSFATKLKVDSSNAITMINDYAVKKALGKGNFGEVFLASDPQGTSYAIKVLNRIKLFGKPIRVNAASKDNDTIDVGANIFVGNLDPEVDEKLLYDTFTLRPFPLFDRGEEGE